MIDLFGPASMDGLSWPTDSCVRYLAGLADDQGEPTPRLVNLVATGPSGVA